MGALTVLNRRTPHRFTGIFKSVGDQLENLYLFDREDFYAAPWSVFPRDHSYCSLVMAGNAPFVLSDSLVDERVAQHHARNSVISYCGVPLLMKDNTIFGTLCHFDYKPILFSDLSLDFLSAAAPIVLLAVLSDLANPKP